jgi:hypothetical protein
LLVDLSATRRTGEHLRKEHGSSENIPGWNASGVSFESAQF